MTPDEVKKVVFQLLGAILVYTACTIAATLWAEGMVTRHVVAMARTVYEVQRVAAK